MSDKFHDECGVVAIYGHPEASKLTYLSLYALQHRGQESAGICTSDHKQIFCHKDIGQRGRYLPAPYSEPCLASLPLVTRATPPPAIRFLLNAQPFSVTCNRGAVAVAHNSNITNAAELRAELSRRGAIFQASSDTEVVLHLVAQSSERTFSGALRDAAITVGRRVFIGLSGAGSNHRSPRPARVPPPRHG